MPLSPGLRLTAVVGPSRIEIKHDNQCAARHPRCYGRGLQILDLNHYLDVLEKKPGAMAGSTPLQQWRQAGRWPECLDRIWGQLEQRQGKSAGKREMITLVRVGSAVGWGRLIEVWPSVSSKISRALRASSARPVRLDARLISSIRSAFVNARVLAMHPL